MKIHNITNILEEWAPLSYQENYDNSGLIVGSLNDNLEGVLVTLDCTEKIIDEAIKKKCNLIIAHHPILFNPLKKLSGDTYVERIIIKAIKNNISIYAIHTNLDNIIDGVNSSIANKLGLLNCKILQPKYDVLKQLVVYCPKDHVEILRKNLFQIGAGSIGDYDNCLLYTSPSPRDTQ